MSSGASTSSWINSSRRTSRSTRSLDGDMGRMGRMGLRAILVVASICLGGCNRQPSPPASTMPAHQDFERLTDDFTRSVLAFSPVAATQAGYHEHNGMALDEAIDDFSPAGIDTQRRF